MKLLKVKDGLIEVENFFLTSFFNDFAGASNVTRDIKTGKLKLISNNSIERKFAYDEFVIQFQKENFKNMSVDDYCLMYLGNKDSKFGIRERNIHEQNPFWKIIKKDNYIQAYVGQDGINYENVGGMEFSEPLTRQGFEKFCDEDFILKNYMVYANPYVTLQNGQEGHTVEFYNKDNDLICTRKFNSEMECRVFLDGRIEGFFIFKDDMENIYYKSDILELGYGDIYILSPYSFEIKYHGSIITNTNPVLLNDLHELISIKNIDTEDYKDINIGTKTSSNDLIQLSFDGKNYFDNLTIGNIASQEEKNIFVKIVKNVENHNFNVRDFQLLIQE